jgi:hypothetical protein
MSHTKTLLLVLVLALAFTACGGADDMVSAAGSAPVSGAPPAPPSPPAPSPPPPPLGSQDFATRRAQPGVLRSVGFDAVSDITGAYGDNSGITTGAATPSFDNSVKASGAGSLKFTIPPFSGADSSGTYFTNFSSDLLLQFGENQEFYVQWRQRFSPEFLNTVYAGGGGWKQIIISTGDKPGCTRSSSASGLCYSSCTELETVANNPNQLGFPQMYNSCAGSSWHGAFEGLYEPFGASDFKLQNARVSPYCLYSQSGAGHFPPAGNCFAYVANEWMTFQIRIQTGPRNNDGWTGSRVTLWVARENQPSELVIDRPIVLNAGSAAADQKFGKVWLLPYNTGKSSAQDHPTAFTWYDELIISRTRIADPAP